MARRKLGQAWLIIGLCAVAAAVILLVLPAEKTLGSVIKIVYLHGALSRAGMLGFAAAGVAALAFLIGRRPAFLRWSQGLALSGWIFWTCHFIASLPATHATWGMWIAWGEPRVTMTLQVIGAGLAVILISLLMQNRYFTAGAYTLLGAAVAFLAERTGVLRHPLDPIGNSPSLEFRLGYALLLIPVIGAMLTLAWRLAAAHMSDSEREAGTARGRTVEVRSEDR